MRNSNVAEKTDKRMEIGLIDIPDHVVMEQVASCYRWDSPNYKFEVVRDPDIQSGEPTIKGTRWPARHLASIAKKNGVDATLKKLEYINKDMVEGAIKWVRKNPA